MISVLGGSYNGAKTSFTSFKNGRKRVLWNIFIKCCYTYIELIKGEVCQEIIEFTDLK